MKATITYKGKSATFDGLDWSGDPLLAKHCEAVEDSIPWAYRPQRALQIAEEVAAVIGDCTVTVDEGQELAPKGESVRY